MINNSAINLHEKLQTLREEIIDKKKQIKIIIAELICQGLSIKEISDLSGTPETTVRSIRKNILNNEL